MAASVFAEFFNEIKLIGNIIKLNKTPKLIKTLYVIELLKCLIYIIFNISFVIVILVNLGILDKMQENSLIGMKMEENYALNFLSYQDLYMGYSGLREGYNVTHL